MDILKKLERHPPKFRITSNGRCHIAVFAGERFNIMHCTSRAHPDGDGRDYWVLWHHDKNMPRDARDYPIWPKAYPGGLGCTDFFDTLEEAKKAVLTILRVKYQGGNVVRLPMRHKAAAERLARA
jgi:hypothetical protein